MYGKDWLRQTANGATILYRAIMLANLVSGNRTFRFSSSDYATGQAPAGEVESYRALDSTLKATNPLSPLLFLEGVPILLCFF